MKQDEARKTKHHHTPSNQGKANGPSHEATRYPEGGTSTETGPGRRKGPTEGGGKQQPAGEGATHSPTKNKDKEASQHRRWHTKAKEKNNRKIAGRSANNTKHNTEEPQHERNRREDQRQTEGKESTAQNKQNQGSRRGTGPQKREQKDPHHAAASGSKSLSSAKGQLALRTKQV